ncbi:MAG: hypothetical protein HS116_09865 [Planctomycetes bacterium]|nr:hypothetical protein [Planctomycetota bacterium]
MYAFKKLSIFAAAVLLAASNAGAGEVPGTAGLEPSAWASWLPLALLYGGVVAAWIVVVCWALVRRGVAPAEARPQGSVRLNPTRGAMRGLPRPASSYSRVCR